MCDLNCQVDGAMFCGDGIVQEPYEQCEPGEIHDEFDIDCIDCSWEGYRLVFVTSVPFDGSMQGGGLPSEGKSGVALADLHCQQLADDEGLEGNFYAWLSDNNATPGHSNAADRIGGASVSYRMRTGGLVATSWAKLLADGPTNPITFTEKGIQLDEIPSRIWSNTAINGLSFSADNCGGWTENMNIAVGHTGITQEGLDWTDSGIQLSCQKKYPLYCFQGEG